MGSDDRGTEKWRAYTPPMRWRTLAGFIVLGVSLVFFAMDAFAIIWWDTEAGLQRPAWALLAVAVYFFFGVWIPMFMQQGRRNGDA